MHKNLLKKAKRERVSIDKEASESMSIQNLSNQSKEIPKKIEVADKIVQTDVNMIEFANLTKKSENTVSTIHIPKI